jgi:hypothetical protein
VTAIQFPIQQSVDGVINWLVESKKNKIQNCLKLPNILCIITCIKARLVTTPLKFHKKFLVYIKIHSEFYVPYFVIRISCSSLFLPCINISVSFCTYQPVSRKLSERWGAFGRLNVWYNWRLSVILSLWIQVQFILISTYSILDTQN